jgi:hypothetical protein
MAKTLTDLIREAENITDEKYDNAVWMEWFNRGIDDLSDATFIEDEIMIIGQAGAFALPDDFLDAILVKSGDTVLPPLPISDTVSRGYHMTLGSIVLQNEKASLITLLYNKRPAYLSTATVAVPIELPDMYTRALVYFAAKESMLRDDEHDRYVDYNEEYNRAKATIHRASRKRKAGIVGQWAVIR